MTSEKYVGMDVHQASTSIAVWIAREELCLRD
jgi:hypothetical protein